jgi:hypothetical protein
VQKNGQQLSSDDDSDSDDSLPAILPSKQPKPHLVSTVDKAAREPLAKPLGEPSEKPAGKKDKPVKKDSTPGAMDVAKNKTAAGMTADVRPAALTKPPGAPLKAAARKAAEHNGANHKAVAVKKRTAPTMADPKVAPSATDKRQPDADAEPTAKKARPTSATSSHQASNSGKRAAAEASGKDAPAPKRPVNVMDLPSCKPKPHELRDAQVANESDMDTNDEDDETLVNIITEDLHSPGSRKGSSSGAADRGKVALKRRSAERGFSAKHPPSVASGSMPANDPKRPSGGGEVKELPFGLGSRWKEPLRTKMQPGDEARLPRRRHVTGASDPIRPAPAAPASGLPASAAQPRPLQAPTEHILQPFLKACQRYLYETLFCEGNALESLALPWATIQEYSSLWVSATLREMAFAAKQNFSRTAKYAGQFMSAEASSSLPSLLHFTMRMPAAFDRSDLVAVSTIDRQTGEVCYLFGAIDVVKRKQVSVMCLFRTSDVVPESFHKLLLEVKDMRKGHEYELRKLESTSTHVRRFWAVMEVAKAAALNNLLARQILLINRGLVPPGRANAKVAQHLERLRAPASQRAAIRSVG